MPHCVSGTHRHLILSCCGDAIFSRLQRGHIGPRWVVCGKRDLRHILPPPSTLVSGRQRTRERIPFRFFVHLPDERFFLIREILSAVHFPCEFLQLFCVLFVLRFPFSLFSS